jgi:hypothetical protein
MQQTTLYETVEATQYGTQTNFEIQAPTGYLAIDPRIWVKYEFEFTTTLADYYHGLDDDLDATFTRSTNKNIAWRHGWCVARGMQTVVCKINDKTTVTHKPRQYLDALRYCRGLLMKMKQKHNVVVDVLIQIQ